MPTVVSYQQNKQIYDLERTQENHEKLQKVKKHVYLISVIILGLGDT